MNKENILKAIFNKGIIIKNIPVITINDDDNLIWDITCPTCGCEGSPKLIELKHKEALREQYEKMRATFKRAIESLCGSAVITEGMLLQFDRRFLK